MTQQNGEPLVSPGSGDQRRYDLAGDGLQIQITSTHLTWPLDLTILSFSYQGSGGNGTFTGDAIRSQTSELGTLLTVTLQIIQVTGEEIKLTILLPAVNLTGAPESGVTIETLAILTKSIDITTGPSPTGQTQTYQVYQLEGTVTLTTLTHPVTLSVDAASYQIGDPISVTLSTQSTQSIEFPDQQTECSVVQLQRQEDGNWKEVNPCFLGRHIIMNTLDAGQHLAVHLVSSSGSAGLYRATLSYRTSEVSNPRTIYSQEFQVIANPEGH